MILRRGAGASAVTCLRVPNISDAQDKPCIEQKYLNILKKKATENTIALLHFVLELYHILCEKL